MRPDPLPPELSDLERDLAARAGPEPPPGLRDRALAAAAAERRAAGRPPHRAFARAWLAAAAVLVLNLAMTVDTALHSRALHAPPGERPVPAPAVTVGEDDTFQTFAAGALARLRPAPDPGAVSRRLIEYQER